MWLKCRFGFGVQSQAKLDSSGEYQGLRISTAGDDRLRGLKKREMPWEAKYATKSAPAMNSSAAVAEAAVTALAVADKSWMTGTTIMLGVYAATMP